MNKLTDKKVLSDEEKDKLLDDLARFNRTKTERRDTLLIRLCMYTGARGCEVLSLTTEDVDFKQKTVTIRAAKGSNDRSIPIPSEITNLLKKHVEEWSIKEGDRLFGITTRRLRNIWDTYRPNRKKGIHSLRHLAGVLLYRKANDVLLVKSLLGHKSILSSMVYLEYVNERVKLREALNNMW